MSLELHILTRSKLLPDPEYDSLTALFFVLSVDENCKDVCKKTGRPTENGSCKKEGFYSLNIKPEGMITSALV